MSPAGDHRFAHRQHAYLPDAGGVQMQYLHAQEETRETHSGFLPGD